MRKNFNLVSDNKQRDRVLDAVKHEIRKYLRRERKRDVPAGSDHWEFDCRFGLTQAAAEVVPLDALIDKVGSAAAAGADAFYVEILARPAVKTAHDRKSTAVEDDTVESKQDL